MVKISQEKKIKIRNQIKRSGFTGYTNKEIDSWINRFYELSVKRGSTTIKQIAEDITSFRFY